MKDYLEKFKLEGKTAVVCGGLGLLGKEIAVALAQAGARVIILDINKDEWKKFREEIAEEILNIEFLKFDITKVKELKKNIKVLFEKFKTIDIWVNTAYPRTKDWGNKLEDVAPESWQRNVDMHMNSYCLMTKEVSCFMHQKKIRGSIVNIASIYGMRGPDFSIYEDTNLTNPAAYAAIKGGIINFTRYVASYYGSSGIRCNAVSPGGVYNNHSEKFVSNYSKRTPLSRMAEPEEIASAVLFLASEASSYITGTNLVVDGGWTII